MLKKMTAIALCLLMVFCCVFSAGAETKFTPKVLSIVDCTAEELTAGSELRAFTAAMMLVDFMLENPSTSEYWLGRISSTGKSYLAKYGSCIDLYLRLSDNTYYNLFYAPYTHEMTDYGTTSFGPSSSEYTYYPLDYSTILDYALQIAEAIEN